MYRVSTELYAAPTVPGATPRLLVNGPVGRPALGGNLVVFELDGRIEAIDLTTGVRTILRRQARAELRGPSVLGNELSYVIATYKRQQVRVGPLRPQLTSSDKAFFGTFPTNRRDLGYEPGHEHAEGHKKHLWPRPQKGVAGHADHHRARRGRDLRHPPAQARWPAHHSLRTED